MMNHWWGNSFGHTQKVLTRQDSPCPVCANRIPEVPNLKTRSLYDELKAQDGKHGWRLFDINTWREWNTKLVPYMSKYYGLFVCDDCDYGFERRVDTQSGRSITCPRCSPKATGNSKSETILTMLMRANFPANMRHDIPGRNFLQHGHPELCEALGPDRTGKRFDTVLSKEALSALSALVRLVPPEVIVEMHSGWHNFPKHHDSDKVKMKACIEFNVGNFLMCFADDVWRTSNMALINNNKNK